MAVVTNLYPPIVDTYMKAFLVNSTNAESNKCKVYFSLSMFNSTSEIKNVQVTIRNQNTNLSVLNSTKYPSGIMLTNLLTDVNVTTSDKYYIEILPSDIEDGNFIVDQYYKVQLRFTSTDASNPPITASTQPIDSWLAANQFYFSEWSTVTLVRGISVPIVRLEDYEAGAVTEVYASVANTRVVGKLKFEDENEDEILRDYQIKLYDEQDHLIFDSGIIYTSNYENINTFNYTIKYDLLAEHFYSFTLDFETQNLHHETLTYYIDVLQAATNPLNVSIEAEMDEENGRAKIDLDRASTYGSYTGQLVIRRSDSKSNFTIWEEMKSWILDGVSSIDLTWYDYTIESGIWYKYAVQGITPLGARTPMTIISAPIMIVFNHMFLTYGDTQLKLAFNPQISSFRRVLSENKIDVIGSPYPFIKRNGAINYAQFPIGGLIASAMDEDGLFITKEQIYGTNKTYYDNFNSTQEIPDYRDLVYERFFREKVMDFLYKDDVKLFRSPTEGNIIIKLMDTQFQPNQTLGRRLWSFTSNAYEIDECNLENFKKYGILTEDEQITVIDSSLIPIKKIMILDAQEEFPDEGRSDVLYIFNRELYIWDSSNSVYNIISVPFWNHDPAIPTIPSNNNLSLNMLYTDGQSLFQWNNATSSPDLISEPLTNNEYLGDAE